MSLFSHARRAFTLIELLVIILIVAVLGSMVVPAYSRLRARTNFEGMIERVAMVFAYAREQAVSRDTVVTARFDTGAQAFEVTVMPTPPQADLPVALMSDAQQAAAMETPPPRVMAMGQDFQIAEFRAGNGSSGDGLTVRFRGDGTCDGAQMLLTSKDGYAENLTVWPHTGRLAREEEGQSVGR